MKVTVHKSFKKQQREGLSHARCRFVRISGELSGCQVGGLGGAGAGKVLDEPAGHTRFAPIIPASNTVVQPHFNTMMLKTIKSISTTIALFE